MVDVKKINFNNNEFVHLHTHTSYSSFDGLSSIEHLVLTAREMGFPALAITDHGNMMGAIKFIKECKAKKDKKGNDIKFPPIKPIIGIETYLSKKMDIGQYSDDKDSAKNNQPEGQKGNKHLTLFARNFEGYKNLCHLSQESWIHGFYFNPRIDMDLLEKHSNGLMCGSACLNGPINRLLLNGDYKEAKNVANKFKEIFQDNFFLEVMYHGILEEGQILGDIFKLGKELNIIVSATNDCHYIKKEDAESQEVLLCMSQSRCIKDPNHLAQTYKEFYLKSAEEMGKIFGKNPSCIYNTVRLAERVDNKDIENNLFGGMRLPKFDLPENEKDPYEYMCKLAWEGMKRVGWDKSQKHIDRLKMELEDVKIAKDNNNYDFSTYFLIVMDYVQEAKRMGGLTGAGRGSGYASVLLRCLGITYGIDPLEYDLIWERFLGFSKKKVIKESDFFEFIKN